MKKILFLICFVLMIGLVYGSGQHGNDNLGMNDESGNTDLQGTENNKPETIGIENTMAEQNKNQIADQEKIQTMNQLKEQIQLKKQDMQKESQGMNEDAQKVYQNQNRVREAVHALQQMKGFVGGIGPQISEIANHFNNSVKNTIEAEEKIQSRSAFSRFFAGGDNKAAEDIEKEVQQNQEKIQELKQLKDECDCEEEVKQMLQEQIQNMDQEQTRLQQLAQVEKNKKGLFGWIWK